MTRPHPAAFAGAPRRGALAFGVAMISALAVLFTGAAQASTPITSYSAIPSNAQAGGHPDMAITFSVENRVLQHSQSGCNCEDARDVDVHFPTGFIGNPHATPQCTVSQFSADECPIDSQVGIAEVKATNAIAPFDTAVYNMVPPPDDAGLLGFKIFLFDTPQFTILGARTGGDYGLDADTISIFHGGFPLEALKEQLWGVPADPAHDLLRLDRTVTPGELPSYLGQLCDASGSLSTNDPRTIVMPCLTNFTGITPTHDNSPAVPFLQNPTTCDTPLASSLEVFSYDGGITQAEYGWPELNGCDQLSFDPSLYAQPTTVETDSASGIDINLTIPQQLSPTIPSPTELRTATVTLPEGFSINPNAADGKTSCSDAAANFGTTLAANCPDFSKVGSLEIDSSALPGPVPGFVYLGQPLPGNRYRIFLVADGFGTHIKLPGSITPDPNTGQLTVTFQNLPQSPLTAFNLHIFGSERGLLATPTQCGSYPVTSTFAPWDDSLAAQSSTQFFTLESGPNGAPCPGPARPFTPGFQAASLNHTPGGHAPFSLEITRRDGDQNLSGLTVTTPPGFSATLAGTHYCSDAALAQAAASTYSGLLEQESPSCPASSQIGTSVASAGAGAHPVYVSGKAYLAGPYEGAPLSIAVITPAVSGPYDLGDVVVRVAIKVDPADAKITAISDPLPRIVQGVPIRLRSLRVDLNRPEFALNPTSCSPMSVGAHVSGDQGAAVDLSQRYQVANCATLPYGPKLSLNLSGGVNRLGHPAIHAVLQTRPGEANARSISVTLPPNELLDNSHIGTVCTRVDFAAQACPASSLLGHVEVTTPLLDQPLRGSAYLRSSGKGLPDLALDLYGQLHIEAVARIDSVNRGLRATFRTVPDVPLGTVVLDLLGGSKGLIQNSESLCGPKKTKAIVKTEGQNGITVKRRSTLHVNCASKAGRRRSHHGGKAGH